MEPRSQKNRRELEPAPPLARNPALTGSRGRAKEARPRPFRISRKWRHALAGRSFCLLPPPVLFLPSPSPPHPLPSSGSCLWGRTGAGGYGVSPRYPPGAEAEQEQPGRFWRGGENQSQHRPSREERGRGKWPPMGTEWPPSPAALPPGLPRPARREWGRTRGGTRPPQAPGAGGWGPGWRGGGRPREAELGERRAPESGSERPESSEEAFKWRETRDQSLLSQREPRLWTSSFRGGALGSLLGNWTLLRDWVRQHPSVLKSSSDNLGYLPRPYRPASFSDSYSSGTEGYCVWGGWGRCFVKTKNSLGTSCTLVFLSRRERMEEGVHR